MKANTLQLFELFQKKRKALLSLAGLLAIIVTALAMQSFSGINYRGEKQMISYDLTVRTTSSFDCQDVQSISPQLLLKAQTKLERKRIEIAVNQANEVSITTIMLDKPRYKHDLKHLVGKTTLDKGGLRMYDFAGKELIVDVPASPHKNMMNLRLAEEQLQNFGLQPALQPISEEEKSSLEKEGVTVFTTRDGSTVIRDNDKEVIINKDYNMIESRYSPKYAPRVGTKSYFTNVGKDQAVVTLQKEEYLKDAGRGTMMRSVVTSTFANYTILKDGRRVLELGRK